MTGKASQDLTMSEIQPLRDRAEWARRYTAGYLHTLPSQFSLMPLQEALDVLATDDQHLVEVFANALVLLRKAAEAPREEASAQMLAPSASLDEGDQAASDAPAPAESDPVELGPAPTTSPETVPPLRSSDVELRELEEPQMDGHDESESGSFHRNPAPAPSENGAAGVDEAQDAAPCDGTESVEPQPKDLPPPVQPPPVEPAVVELPGTEPASSGSVRARMTSAARSGIPFEGQVVLPQGFRADRAEGHEAAGFDFDAEEGVFRGTPSGAGSFEVRLLGSMSGRPAVADLILTVSPDPWSLWKNVPSNPDGRFAKVDEESHGIDAEMRLLFARRRGRKHAQTGAYCDDDGGIVYDEGSGWHVAVVADGAGSATFSRQGSRLVARSLLEAVPAALAKHVSPALDAGEQDSQVEPLLYHAFAGPAHKVSVDLRNRARDYEVDADDLSTTVVLGTARRVGDGWFCASFSVGDGLAAIWDEPSRTVTRMMTGDTGEFAGQTRFLRSGLFKDAQATMKRIHLSRPESFTAFALMTDGVSDARFPTAAQEVDASHWGGLWRDELEAVLGGDEVPADDAARELLEWLNFKVPGEHDDRTIALMMPRGRTGS
jgi:hypothetical protein